MKICSVEFCENALLARSWCNMHYSRWRAHGDPLICLVGNLPEFCTIDDCLKPYFSAGWCAMHNSRNQRLGNPLAEVRAFGQECSVDGCDKKHVGNGYCSGHRERFLTYGDAMAYIPLTPKQSFRLVQCSFESCFEMITSKNDSGFCRTHRQKLIDNPRRKANKRNAFIENIDRESLYSAYHGLCYLCWQLAGADWHLEHIVPLSRGGKHCYENVAVSCASCNLKKNRSTFTEFAYKTGGFTFYDEVEYV